MGIILALQNAAAVCRDEPWAWHTIDAQQMASHYFLESGEVVKWPAFFCLLGLLFWPLSHNGDSFIDLGEEMLKIGVELDIIF